MEAGEKIQPEAEAEEQEVVEGNGRERGGGRPGGELVPAGAPGVAPAVATDELVQRLDRIKDASDRAMQDGVDYGAIPGTDKPTLLKPGAEKLGVMFQLDVQIQNEKEWGPGDHLTVVSHATAFHAPTGTRLGYGEGVCTTRERKYAYRKEQRVCPECEAPAVIKGKKEYGGGWLCWKKKDGCGTTWEDGSDQAQAFEEAEVGEIDNPDLPDLWNTVVKMAEKRARVDAVLAVTGASALFTQDMEEKATREAEGQGGSVGPPAGEELTSQLKEELLWLLPEDGAKEAWGLCKVAGGGELVEPICQLVVELIGQRRAIDDPDGQLS